VHHSLIELKQNDLNKIMYGHFFMTSSNLELLVLGGILKITPDAPNPVLFESASGAFGFVAKY
jgi:hypothetical protein